MSIPESFYQLGDRTKLRTINLLVYAYPGGGKTVLAGSGGRRSLILDMDTGEGTASAEALGSDAFVQPTRGYQDLHEAYEYLRHSKHSFSWVWWDSGTLFQDRALIDDVTADAHAENKKQDEHVPSQREYLKNMNQFMQYVRWFAALPINFGVTAHVSVMEDIEREELVLCPAFQGKNMPSKVMGYMNVVGHLKKRETEKGAQRRLVVQPRGAWIAKDRFNSLGSFVAEPSVPKIEELIAKNFPSIPVSSGPSRTRKRQGTSSKKRASRRRK